MKVNLTPLVEDAALIQTLSFRKLSLVFQLFRIRETFSLFPDKMIKEQEEEAIKPIGKIMID